MEEPQRPFATAFELALVAAAVDAKLAKIRPAQAVGIAATLLKAAQKVVDRPAREERIWNLQWERLLRLFPDGDRVPLGAAFDRFGPAAGYKTPRAFIAALRKEKLTTEFLEEDERGHLVDPFFKKGPPRFVEVTSARAVETLCRRREARRRKADRERKAGRQTKSSKKITRNHRAESRKSSK